LKATHSTLHKTITWTKKFGKGHNECQKACLDVGISHQKMKTLMKTKFANKVIIFQKTLEYWDTINLFYGRQETQDLQGHVLDAHTWAICKMVVKTMPHVVKQCTPN